MDNKLEVVNNPMNKKTRSLDNLTILNVETRNLQTEAIITSPRTNSKIIIDNKKQNKIPIKKRKKKSIAPFFFLGLVTVIALL